jgi:hypothetical protein
MFLEMLRNPEFGFRRRFGKSVSAAVGLLEYTVSGTSFCPKPGGKSPIRRFFV